MEKAKRLTVVVNLGNDLMQTVEDLAEALRAAAREIENRKSSGSILDGNGNRVGHFILD